MTSTPDPARDPARRLEGMVALVTGGAQRVGRAIALRLGEAGMDVAVTYRTSAVEAEQVVKRITQMGRRAQAIRVDLADANAANQVHGKFIECFDRLDALVNNASWFDVSPIGQITTDLFDRSVAINCRAPLMLIQKFAPMLARHYPDCRGRVINFIDIHVMGQPLAGYAAYNASKAALEEVTMTAAIELAPQTTVNAIAPGVVAWAPSYTASQRKLYMKRVPLGRPGTPQDAAAAVLFLVRDADYCTGQIIKLDGGRLLT